MKFEAAKSATKGAREYQEDSAAFWPESGGPGDDADLGETSLLAVLADGMGGHAGGALASKMVCDTFIDFVKSEGLERGHLAPGLEAANGSIASTISVRPELSGMGSTLVAALFNESGMEWVSVGDSPLYLFRRGEVALINEDHSLAPALDQLAREGKITEDQARQDPRRHMLRSAVTGEDLELVDLSKKALQLVEGDIVLLASDGIHTLEEDEIARVTGAYAPDGVAAIAEALVRAVENIRAPHQDNTTVIAVQPVF